MKTLIRDLKKKENLIRVFAAAILFFAVALPFRMFMGLLPGVTEFRPANAIPPVLGILWGPYAALGIAVGNLISDMLTGNSAFICLTGFITNFLYAYLPFKMWYFMKSEEEDTCPSLASVRQIIKYIGIILLNGLTVTGMLSTIFETAGFADVSDSYILFVYNNFHFAVILGVPLFLLIRKVSPYCYIPVSTENGARRSALLLYLAAGAGMGYFVLSRAGIMNIGTWAAPVLFIIMTALALIYCIRPCTFRTGSVPEQDEAYIKFPIKTKVTVGFLLIAVVFLGFTAAIAYQARGSYDSALEHWMFVYTVMAAAITIIFAAAIVFLWYVETRFVNALERLSESARTFAGGDRSEMRLQAETVQIDTQDEIQSLAESINRMMQDIADYVVHLQEVTAEKERISAELNVASKIQVSMLPCIFPPYPERKEFDIAASMVPAKEVGGDFYDFFLIDEDHLCLVIADVSGKGVPAALFMVITKTLMKNAAQFGAEPAEIFRTVNDQLCENNDAEMFVTAFLGILTISTGAFAYVNAGHNPPFIKRHASSYEMLPVKRGFVLAGMEGMNYEQCTVQLEAGDRLFLYTDGVTEAADVRMDLFGEDRLQQFLNHHKEVKVSVILPFLQRRLEAFASGMEQADDITMLGIEYRKNLFRD